MRACAYLVADNVKGGVGLFLAVVAENVDPVVAVRFRLAVTGAGQR